MTAVTAPPGQAAVRPHGLVELCGWGFVILMPLIQLPVGVAGLVLLAALLPYLVLFRSGARISAPIIWLSIVACYQVSSGLLSGVPATAFTDFTFWRRDGKFFIAYLPMLVASFMALERATVVRMLRALVLIAAAIAVLGILEYALAMVGVHPVSFLVHRGSETGSKLVFTLSRTNSHNAVGGFYAALTVLTFGQLLAGHWRGRWWLVFFALGLGVLLTLSRAFVFALVLTVVPAGLAWGGRRVLKLLLVAGILSAPFLAGGFLKRVVELRSPQDVYNARVRLDYWKRASGYIARSPWLGVGWSRFNDVPVPSFGGAAGVLQWPKGAAIVSDDGHAHNALLMIWAETGLVGVALWSGFIGSIVRRARRRHRDRLLAADERGLGYGSIMGFAVLLAASLVAFNIVTPSSVWPVGFFAGATLGIWRSRAPASAGTPATVDPSAT